MIFNKKLGHFPKSINTPRINICFKSMWQMEVSLMIQRFVLVSFFFSGLVMKLHFWDEEKALKLYAVGLMPTVETMESLWDMSACISRGIKENMQRKTHWKDKCVGTLWRTQKWKLSLGTNMKYFFTLNPQWIQCNFFLCLQCHCGITVSLVKLVLVGVSWFCRI